VVVRVGQQTERIAAHTVLWGAGVQASPLGQVLARSAGAKLDRAGRVMVQPDLTVSGHPEVFVIGDLAHCPGPDGQPLPGVAPVAMQQGRYVAQLIAKRLSGGTLPPFRLALAALFRVDRVDVMAFYPSALPGSLREPLARHDAVGVELLPAGPLGPADHGRERIPLGAVICSTRPAVRQFVGICLAARLGRAQGFAPVRDGRLNSTNLPNAGPRYRG
jgi:hypothetical protein